MCRQEEAEAKPEAGEDWHHQVDAIGDILTLLRRFFGLFSGHGGHELFPILLSYLFM